MTQPTQAEVREAMVERVAIAIAVATNCGFTLGDDGERGLCDDPRALELQCEVCNCRVGADAALAAADSLGWQLVPKEPTEELLAHARTVLFHLRRGDHVSAPWIVPQMIDALTGAIDRAETAGGDRLSGMADVDGDPMFPLAADPKAST